LPLPVIAESPVSVKRPLVSASVPAPLVVKLAEIWLPALPSEYRLIWRPAAISTLGSGIGAEHCGTAAAAVEVDIAVVRRRLQRAGRCQVQRATVANVELKVVLQVERTRDVQRSVEIAVVEIRRQFACAGQRDRAGARHHAAVPGEPAERERGTAVQRAGEVQHSGDRCGRAVDIQRAVVQRVVAVDRDAGGALQTLRAGVRIGRRLQHAFRRDRIAELDRGTGTPHGAKQDVALACGEHRDNDVGALIADCRAVAVAGLHRDVAGALRDDAQVGAMCAAGHEVDAGARSAFFATEIARFDQQAAAGGKRQRTGRFSGEVAASGVVERTSADRDRAQRAQDDVGRLALFLDFTLENDRGAECGCRDRPRVSCRR
jgi:hypothetical protein